MKLAISIKSKYADNIKVPKGERARERTFLRERAPFNSRRTFRCTYGVSAPHTVNEETAWPDGGERAGIGSIIREGVENGAGRKR